MLIEKNIILKKYTTIRIGGKSKNIFFPESEDDVYSLKKNL